MSAIRNLLEDAGSRALIKEDDKFEECKAENYGVHAVMYNGKGLMDADIVLQPIKEGCNFYYLQSSVQGNGEMKKHFDVLENGFATLVNKDVLSDNHLTLVALDLTASLSTLAETYEKVSENHPDHEGEEYNLADNNRSAFLCNFVSELNNKPTVENFMVFESALHKTSGIEEYYVENQLVKNCYGVIPGAEVPKEKKCMKKRSRQRDLKTPNYSTSSKGKRGSGSK